MRDVRGTDKEWRKISSVSTANLIYETWEYRGEYVHFAKTLGTVKREESNPDIEASLRINKTGNFFRLFDNRGGYDSILSYEDYLYFGDMLKNAGIKRFFNAVVTEDKAYSVNAKLIEAIGQIKQIKVEVYYTSEYNEALDFIKREIAKVSDRK